METILEWKPQTQVIMVTSVTRKEILDECTEKGAFDVLLKPVTAEKLTGSIRRALEKRDKTP